VRRTLIRTENNIMGNSDQGGTNTPEETFPRKKSDSCRREMDHRDCRRDRKATKLIFIQPIPSLVLKREHEFKFRTANERGSELGSGKPNQVLTRGGKTATLKRSSPLP